MANRLRVVAILFAAGCVEAGSEDEGVLVDEHEHDLVVQPTLQPPAMHVRTGDGGKLDLEQAGILAPGGRTWAVVLGKTLFWDQQAGSDGNACASCHFHAGADSRLRGQISPGISDVTHGPGGDVTFGSQRSDTGTVAPGRTPSGGIPDGTYVLKPADMPMHKLTDETNRNSPIISTTNDRVSSLGSYAATFEHVQPFGLEDACSDADPSVYHAGSHAARQVEPRQSPSFINAAFNHRNFWDNRANNLFNGVGVFGLRDIAGDPNKRLVVIENGVPVLRHLSVEDASLASQAVGPPLSALEMSCNGRTFADVGRRLLFTLPLLHQRVSPSDSVLGAYANPWGKGLRLPYTYAYLIARTFSPKYWALPGRWKIVDGNLVKHPHGYTQMELNFSMFWGLAIAEFERTQISDRSEVDALQDAGRLVMNPFAGCQSPTGDVDPLLVRGCSIFFRFQPVPGLPDPADGARGGNCVICHNHPSLGFGRTRQPLLSESAFLDGETFPLFLTVPDSSGRNDLRDNGSANIGLRNVFSDHMNGGRDPYGNPLTFGGQLWDHYDGKPGAVLDPPLQRLIDAGTIPTRVGVNDPTPPNTFRKLGADGASKVPILRNVALTPPYFSWGGYASLRQVLKIYNRGMSRRDITGTGSPDAHGTACSRGDDTGTGPDGRGLWPDIGDDCSTNTTGAIFSLGLSDCDANGAPNAACLAKGHTVATDDLAALQRFLSGLTDRRVQCDQAPFDHPSLDILDGARKRDKDHDGKADDHVFELPAVGASGYARHSGLCIPNAGDLFAPGMQARAGGKKAPVL